MARGEFLFVDDAPREHVGRDLPERVRRRRGLREVEHARAVDRPRREGLAHRGHAQRAEPRRVRLGAALAEDFQAGHRNERVARLDRRVRQVEPLVGGGGGFGRRGRRLTVVEKVVDHGAREVELAIGDEARRGEHVGARAARRTLFVARGRVVVAERPLFGARRRRDVARRARVAAEGAEDVGRHVAEVGRREGDDGAGVVVALGEQRREALVVRRHQRVRVVHRRPVHGEPRRRAAQRPCRRVAGGRVLVLGDGEREEVVVGVTVVGRALCRGVREIRRRRPVDRRVPQHALRDAHGHHVVVL
mmetsp:Transcript_15062/g.60499  ORF Transcript_15062/g.60499 Transcript_15062/m.60499 type:complete len:305 (-) Transcript_15062:570-1484(-)